MSPKGQKTKRVLARVAPEHFVGRGEHLRAILEHAGGKDAANGMALLSAPYAGATELLRQAYDELFRQRGGPAPVYFSFARGDGAVASMRRFIQVFITQVAAHKQGDPALISAPVSLRALLDLVTPSDFEWVERLIESAELAVKEGDDAALIQICLNAPRQAASKGAKSVLLLDDVHTLDANEGVRNLASSLISAATGWGVPFVVSGLRRKLFDVLGGAYPPPGLDSMRKLHLSNLNEADSRTLVETLSGNFGVNLSDETRDLLVQQLGGNPSLTMMVIQAAQSESASLTSFREFQRVYVDELLGGRINRRFNHVLEEIAPSPSLRRGLLRALHESSMNANGRSPVELWLKRLGLDPLSLERVLRALHAHELANFHATFIETNPGTVWRDFLRANYRLQVMAEPRALVVADTLVETLKRAPQAMARHYRRSSSLNLSDVLSRFNLQNVPASLLQYDRFARLYRGAPLEEVSNGLDAETETVRLPQVVYVASCASFHPPMSQICDEERCAVAHGFESTSYAESEPVVWMAAEVDSKLEAGRALTEVWLDRLSHVAEACGFERVRIWLVSPEGFTADASELLRERGAYGVSRAQLKFLVARMDSPPAASASDVDEFAMEIPMGEDSELIAAKTVEQIARRMEFHPEAINQIKTALVEACINATEHSLSPERKIYNRFRVEDDKLVITVSSRGLSLPSSVSANGTATIETNGNAKGEGAKERRGWGLKLIRSLMDDVEFERVEDGTRLRMTKYLRREKGSQP